MGQKVNPHGLRVGVINGWDSRWYAADKDVGDLLVEDYKIRNFLKDKYYEAGIPNIEIERDNTKTRVIIHCARPGLLVGRGGSEVEKIEKVLGGMTGKPAKVSIVEVRSPDLSAQLVAENIAAQLEKRVSFRRAMKLAMGRAMKLGAKGIKTYVSGRLGGAEIARTEHYNEGTIPLQTLRADIDYGFAEAKTTYGRIGVKCWLYKGEVLQGGPRATQVEAPKRDRRQGDRRQGDRRQGDRRQGERRPGGERRGFGEHKQFSNGPRGPQAGAQRPGFNGQNRQGFNANRTPRPASKPEGGAQ